MLLVAINLQSTICTSADLLFHHTISMTMMDNDDVKIVSDVLDDVQPKEREKERVRERERRKKKEKKFLFLNCFFVRICKASIILFIIELI